MVEWIIGGVPEHFNLPWYDCVEHDAWRDIDVQLQWRDCPGGTGQMCQWLTQGQLDLAVILTEGAVAQIAYEHAPFSIVGTYVPTPLQWGVHVHAKSAFMHIDDLRARRFGISRYGSGSHIMALVLDMQRDWLEGEQPQLIPVGNFQGAKRAFDEDRIDGFLWERWMTKPMVDSGEWRCIDLVVGAWPAFVIVARNELCTSHSAQIRGIIQNVHKQCVVRRRKPIELLEQLHSRFALPKQDLRDWLAEMVWQPISSVSSSALHEVAKALMRCDILESMPHPESLIDTLCCDLGP